LKLSTEGLERPLSTYRESRLPLVFILGLLLFTSLGFYLYKNHTLNEIYLNYKEKFIGLSVDEKKEYLNILYSKKNFSEATLILQEIISLPIEDNEQNNSFLAFLYFTQEDYEKSLAIYEKLVKESKSPEQYIFYYASCLFHQGKMNEALQQHYQLFAIADYLIDNVESILKILLEQKKKQEGLNFLEGYLSKYPTAQSYLGLYNHRFNQIIEPNKIDSSIIRIPEINKTFYIKVKIGTNDYPYTYIVDTGASITTINPQMFKYNEGVITKTGKTYICMNADGSKTEAEEVHIEWIKIGDIELKNVKAALKQKGSNLLGQNVLGKLKINIQKENNINIMTLTK
jgi:clan AA aspartic protease (TIGR02281 family)